MNRLSYPLLTLVPAIVLSPAAACAEPARLTLSANTPTASVALRNRERAPLVLPELEYLFQIEASCENELSPASLSLAVADTRRSFDARQIKSGELQNVPLRVPANQLAPVVIADFCVAADADERTDSLQGSQSPITIHAALSAQASFLCLGESVHSMTYANTPLDVVLVCGNESAVNANPAAE